MADKSVIADLGSRIRRLIDDHRRLSELRADLEAQCSALKAENRSLQERVRRLDAELSRRQLAEGLAGGDSDREKARARINRLMREVDRCIALLDRREQTGETTQER